MRESTTGSVQRREAQQRGFSLVEVMIAAVLLFMVIGISARLLSAGQNLLGTTSIASEAKQRADRVAAQIADRIRNGVLETLQCDCTDHDGFKVTDPFEEWHPKGLLASPKVYVPLWHKVGFRVALAVGFEGEPLIGDYLIFAPEGDGESLLTNQVDEDRDNIWDERALNFRYFPGAPLGTRYTLWKVPTGTPVDGGRLAGGLGILLPSPAEQPKVVDGALWVNRKGRLLTIRIGVLRADPTLLNEDRSPHVRSYVGTSSVVLFN